MISSGDGLGPVMIQFNSNTPERTRTIFMFTVCVIPGDDLDLLICLHNFFKPQMDGLVQDCSISIANALELLQSCSKPLKYVPNTRQLRQYSNQYKMAPVVLQLF